jgi:putative peptide maturation system protein
VEYADHWAANYVVSVNDYHVSIQEALMALKLTGRRHPDLMAELVGDALMWQALEEDAPLVSEVELQQAADDFRSANGLCSAEATHRWLEEMQLSMAQFQRLLQGGLLTRKLKERVTEGGVQPYFAAHREQFDIVHCFRADAATETGARRLAEAARTDGLLAATQAQVAAAEGQDLQGSLMARHRHELPAALAAAAPGAVVGPVAEGQRYWVAQVLGQQPAQLDAQTRTAIRVQLFQAWLAEQRQRATVRWHWM